MINVANKWHIGETVYLKTDEEAKARLVYQIVITKSEIIYGLCCGVTMSNHYDFEITEEKPVFI